MVAVVSAGEVSHERIRESAAKAVALVQKSQKGWYAKQSCFSCHQQVLPAIAFRYARDHGVPVDEQAARADAVAGFGFYSRLAQAVEYTQLIDPALSDGNGLLAANAVGVRPSIVTAVYSRLIAARQEADGHWETIDTRPPQSYSKFTATAIALHAVRLYAHPSQKAEVASRLARALAWLVSHQPRGTEERTYQLLGAYWAGADQSTLRKMAAGLKGAQQPDGGWNSRDGRSSDAYSTGEALYALHDAGGIAVSDVAWQRGIEYLLRTQAPDGSWHVVSRLEPPAPVSPPYFETGHPYGHDQFISAMGECMAIVALSISLGPAKPVQLVLRQAEPQHVEPWGETLLFGSTDDVRKLLDGGFNPNSTTSSGGLTALMLAAPDVAKMKLLLDRGANADARDKNRYSALLVAAQYPNSDAAMNLLLDHGAKVRLPKGQGAPLYNAFPIMLAAFSDNASIIDRLHRAGDRTDDKMILLGLFQITPMIQLAGTDKVASARALVDAGANVNDVDADGINALSWAVISNRVSMARFLIERGADINHVDRFGMTPLLYAASADFGDPSMVDLLIKAGARPDVRTKQGLTALDLARQYKHDYVVPSLEQRRTSR